MSTYGWTQPCCNGCWYDRNGDREPYRAREPQHERCVYCGKPTGSGIYVRVDPSTALHPTLPNT